MNTKKSLLKAMLIMVCSIAVFLGSEMVAKASEVVYYDSVEEAGTALREGMKARKETIEIGFTTTKELDNSIIKEFVNEAFKHTGVPTEGDYLKGHYKSYKASAKGSSKNGVYKWVFTYTVKYTSTAEQEKETDKAVKDILSQLDLDGKDTYIRIKKIYDYMCENVSYDWVHADESTYDLAHTAYAAAIKKTSVCEGYSLLLYRLLLESDIDIRVIKGTGKGDAHSWDIIKVDGLYYLTDATWDSAYNTHDWFLKGTDSFENHKENDEFKTSAFKKAYPLSDKQYRYTGEHDHEYEKSVTKATFSKNGKIAEECTICGKEKSSTTIPKVKSAVLKTKTYTYNGKQKKPAVTVKDSKGNVLEEGTDYKLTYAKGRKNVGQYNVKVTLQGNYSGSKTLTFKIRPEATKISSLTAGSKCFTVKYKKVTTQTTGYQIQYSTSSDFESAKTTLVKDNTTVSKKIKSLSAKKKYYVRVRTYKTVKIDGESTKIYSAWSSSKNVKTK